MRVSPEVRPTLANAILMLGDDTVAELLGLSRSALRRWVRGEEGIVFEKQSIVGLDVVMSALRDAMAPAAAGIWLVSPNEFLGGARPVDAFRLDGHSRVVEAVQAYAEGAFA